MLVSRAAFERKEPLPRIVFAECRIPEKGKAAMRTLQENETMRKPQLREDGSVDLLKLGRRQLEASVN